MSAKNRVISGAYNKNLVTSNLGGVYIVLGWLKEYKLNKDNVLKYEVLDEETQKSAASAVGRGLLGSLLLGPVGLLAGLSAKSKHTYIVALEFNDGNRSLLEIDEKIYKRLMTELF